MAHPRIMVIGIAALAAGFMAANNASAAPTAGDAQAVYSAEAGGLAQKVDTRRRLLQRGQNGRVFGRDGNGVKHHGYLFSPRQREAAYLNQGTRKLYGGRRGPAQAGPQDGAKQRSSTAKQ